MHRPVVTWRMKTPFAVVVVVLVVVNFEEIHATTGPSWPSDRSNPLLHHVVKRVRLLLQPPVSHLQYEHKQVCAALVSCLVRWLLARPALVVVDFSSESRIEEGRKGLSAPVGRWWQRSWRRIHCHHNYTTTAHNCAHSRRLKASRAASRYQPAAGSSGRHRSQASEISSRFEVLP